MKIASVVGGVQPLLARAGCSKMPRKSFLNRSRKLPGTSRSSLCPPGTHFAPPGGHLGPPGARFGPPLGLLGRSWGSPWALSGASGELLGPPKAPGGSPGGPPHRSLIFEAFWEQFWLHFWTPRTSKIKVFVWNGCIFQIIARFEKSNQK